MTIKGSLTAVDVKGFSFVISNTQRIRSLILWSIQMDAVCQGYLAEFLGNDTSLTEIQFRNTGLKEDGLVRILTALKKNTHLRAVGICNSQIKQAGHMDVADFLSENETLTRFCLNETSFSKQAVGKLLAALKRNTTLEVFEFNHEKVHDSAQREKLSDILATRSPPLYIQGFTGCLPSGGRFEGFGSRCLTLYGHSAVQLTDIMEKYPKLTLAKKLKHLTLNTEDEVAEPITPVNGSGEMNSAWGKVFDLLVAQTKEHWPSNVSQLSQSLSSQSTSSLSSDSSTEQNQACVVKELIFESKKLSDVILLLQGLLGHIDLLVKEVGVRSIIVKGGRVRSKEIINWWNRFLSVDGMTVKGDEKGAVTILFQDGETVHITLENLCIANDDQKSVSWVGENMEWILIKNKLEDDGHN